MNFSFCFFKKIRIIQEVDSFKVILPRFFAGIFLGKHRDRLDIIVDILKVAKYGSTKTNIMLKANLSYDLLEKYLELAVKYGFVRLNSKNYQLTDNGKKFLYRYIYFLNRYSKVQGLISDLDCERKMIEQIVESKVAERINETA